MKVLELFTESLTKVYEFVENDQAKKELFLETIKDIYNNEVGFKSALKNLYKQDPEMIKIASEISKVVLILKGLLPQIKDEFNENFQDYESPLAFSYDIQDQAFDILIQSYEGSFAYDENNDLLSVIGDNIAIE